MLWTIIVAIVTGLIIGALARAVMPGHQNISMVATIAIGILGSVIGSWLVATLFGYNNANGGISWIGIAAGVLVAAGLIALYMNITGRKAVGR